MTSTDWHAYDVPELAGIVNEDLTEGWNHVWAWALATDMLHAARDQLETARASLAAVWTAETSPAAQEFFNFVEAVSESMAATAVAATANRTAMQQVLDSQANTRNAVNDLHGSWQSWSRDARMSTITVDQADAESVLNDLNARAAAHMTAADIVITDATSALVVPHIFNPGDFINRLRLVPGTDGTPSGNLRATGSPAHTGGSIPSQPGEGTGGVAMPGSGSTHTHSGLGNTGFSEDPSEAGPTGAGPDPGMFGARPGQRGTRSATPRRGTSPGSLSDDSWYTRAGAPGTVRSSPVGELGYVDGSPVPAATSSTTPGPVPGTAGGHDEGLVPPMMYGGNGWGSNRRSRRGPNLVQWDIPVGVPAILIPSIDNEVHDPGSGVIGIDL